MSRVCCSRRTLLTGSLAAIAGVGLAGCRAPGTAPHARVDTRGEVPMHTPLAIPPLAEASLADGVRTFELTAEAGDSSLVPGTRTPTMGYNGIYLGPTLRAARGDRLRVRVRNRLDVLTTVHWHGMHLPAAMDGGPHQPIPPNQVWTPEWTIDQPAATLWYHPHPHGATEEQVGAGLAGLFLVDDPAADHALPQEYGVDDLPLVLQDLRLAADGSRSTARSGNVGMLGDTVLVNGTYGARFEATTDRVRLRVLNASPARIYQLGLSDGGPLVQVASDGGLLARPVQTPAVLLSPGERAEVVVDLQPGRDRLLQAQPFDLGHGLPSTEIGTQDGFDLLLLHPADRLEPRAPLPDRLVEVDQPDADAAGAEREFELEGTEINDRRMDPQRIDFTVTANSTEVWTAVNGNGDRPHNFHVHDVQFQVLSIAGAPPPPHLAGRKDTVLLLPDLEYRLLLHFSDYADPVYPYMYHCHLLWHEDQGMMGQFLVLEPGQEPVGPPAMNHHGH